MEASPPPLKISQAWLEDDEFSNIVKTEWKKLNPSNPDLLMIQFTANLSRINKSIK